jgi:hypothetical protein
MKNKGVMVKLALAGLVSLFLLMVTATPAACVQQVTTVSIGDVSLQQGDSTTIPIMITKATAQAVSSARINLTYDSSVVQVTAVGGSEFDNFNSNIVDGKVRMIGWQSGASLTTPIKFADVTIKAIGKSGCTPLNLEIVELNMATGSPISPREVRNGSVCITVPVPEYNIFGLSALVGLLAIILGISIRAKKK